MSKYDHIKALNAVENRIEQANCCADNINLIFKFENYFFANGLPMFEC